MKVPPVTIGLYRHFKGQYYYVQNIVKDAVDEKTAKVVYFNVLHPEYGCCVRDVNDFITDFDTKQGVLIKDRKDNVTGQLHRMERVVSLTNEVKNLSTETLINELKKRADSPLQDLDVQGLSDRVFCTDYVVGTKMTPSDVYPHNGLSVTAPPFADVEDAKKYFESHKHRRDCGVFKRVFIPVEE